MWRRTYLVLIIVRLYFALSPSYIHPDENFQGPEVIAGEFYFITFHDGLRQGVELHFCCPFVGARMSRAHGYTNVTSEPVHR